MQICDKQWVRLTRNEKDQSIDEIDRLYKKYNLNIIFLLQKTFRKYLTRTKQIKQYDNKYCICEVLCECGQKYIGKTERLENPLQVDTHEGKQQNQQLFNTLGNNTTISSGRKMKENKGNGIHHTILCIQSAQQRSPVRLEATATDDTRDVSKGSAVANLAAHQLGGRTRSREE